MSDGTPPAAGARRRHAYRLVAAAVLTLAVAGVIVGWAVFGPTISGTTTSGTSGDHAGATRAIVTPSSAPPPAQPGIAAPPAASGVPPAPSPPPAAPGEPAPATVSATGVLLSAPCPALEAPGPAPRCAVLRAPQDWTRADGPSVDMFVMVLPATGPTVVPDPLVVLSGGPGQAGSAEAPYLLGALGVVRGHRDIVLVDQRGTGRSRPALHCPGIDAVTFWMGGLTATAVEACLDPVRAQGYRLESFDTAQAARDLAALRHALGLAQWNVLATSYGTILAGELYRIDGPAVRSLVLNSPTTATATWLDRERFQDTRRIFLQLAQDCAGQPDCARAFPGLSEMVPRVAAAFRERPLPLDLATAADPAGPVLHVTWDRIVGTLGFRLGSDTGAAEVPAMLGYLDRIGGGETAADGRLLAEMLMPQGFRRVFDRLAYGLNLVIGCRENRPRVDPVQARAEGEAMRPFVAPNAVETDYDVACPDLALPPAGPDLYRPVTGDVPTLILTGAYDTLVPRARVAELAASLSRATVVTFRGIGHDVLGASACAAGIATRFLEDLGAAPPAECAERYLPPAFRTTPFGMPGAVKK